MGFSLISINVRRKLKLRSTNEDSKPTTSKSRSLFQFSKPSSTSVKTSTSSNVKPGTGTTLLDVTASATSSPSSARVVSRRLRFRDASPDDLVHILASLQSVPPAEQVAVLTDRLTSDSTLLARFLDVLVGTSTSSFMSSSSLLPFSKSDDLNLARSRLRLPWVVSTLIRHGDPSLREAVANDPALIRRLASVFDVKVGDLDEGRATLVADVLRALLHSHSKKVATALHSTSALRSLTRHVAVQPAADLLPRFIGTHVFTSYCPGQFLVAHKRAVAALAAARVQTLLADRFVRAAADIVDANSSDGLESTGSRRMVIAASAAMAEISARAARLHFKPEDVDERADNVYASTLGLVTSSGFNDAKRYLDFFDNPAPAVSVLRVALLDCGSDPEIILPALNMLTTVFTSAREARCAEPPIEASTITLPSIPVSLVSNPPGPSPLGLALIEFVSQLADLLAFDDCNQVTPVHLSVLDLLRDMIDVLDDETVFNVLCESECKIMFSLLALATHFSRSNVLMVRVGQIFAYALEKSDDIVNVVVARTGLIDFLWRFRQELALRPALDAIMNYVDLARLHKLSVERLKTFECLRNWYNEGDVVGGVDAQDDGWGRMAMEAKKAHVVRGQTSEISSADLISAPNEDFGQDLYVMAILNEVSSQGNKIPPKDDFLGMSAEIKSKKK